MKISETIWLICGMVPPSPTLMSDLSCIAFTKRMEKLRANASGGKKCLVAQMVSFGGKSHGITLQNRRITLKRRRRPKA